MLGSLHHHSSSSDTDNNNGTKNGSNSGGGVLAAAAAPSARDLVLASADLLQRGDLPAARRAAGVLLSAASPRADAADRLAYHFARALALRADARASAGRVAPGLVPAGARPASSSAYLAFNQIAPFLRFAHLTANQAILDAVEGARRIHILDLDAAHGSRLSIFGRSTSRRSCSPPPPPTSRSPAGAPRSLL